MELSPAIGFGIALLTVCGAAMAQDLDGSWSMRSKRDAEEFTYEVNLDHVQGRLIGQWSMGASRSSAGGCLLGGPGRDHVRFRTCTIDGSAGARNLDKVCPDYEPESSRFVLKGSKLAWESWDERKHSWQLFLLLERAEPTQSLIWDQELCGKPEP